jgi:hypothetical protein
MFCWSEGSFNLMYIPPTLKSKKNSTRCNWRSLRRTQQFFFLGKAETLLKRIQKSVIAFIVRAASEFLLF